MDDVADMLLFKGFNYVCDRLVAWFLRPTLFGLSNLVFFSPGVLTLRLFSMSSL